MSRNKMNGLWVLVLVLFAALSLTSCGILFEDDDDDDAAPVSGQLFVVSEGTKLSLYSIDSAGTLTKLDSASIPSAGLLSVHAIFGITKHPTKPWLYVTSLNECSADVIACWGNARVDKFSYTATKITYDWNVFSYSAASGPVCADAASGFAGQTGTCAPTTSAFSSDGSRLYVDDDDDDIVQIFSVDPTDGDLTFLWEGADTDINGLDVSPDGNYLYNGSNVLQLTGDTAAVLVNGSGGNATEVVANQAGDYLLATTLNTDTLEIYDLTDQAAPALVNSLAIADAPNVLFVSAGSARFQAHSKDLSTFIVVGAESVATVSFDGATLTLLDQKFDTDDTLDVINRGVAVTKNGKYALINWFKPYDAVGDPLLTGGITVYEIAANGSLSVKTTKNFAVPSRATLAVPTP